MMANLIKQVCQLSHYVWMLFRYRFEPSFILGADVALQGSGGGRSKHQGKISSVTTKPNKWIKIIHNKEGVQVQIPYGGYEPCEQPVQAGHAHKHGCGPSLHFEVDQPVLSSHSPPGRQWQQGI